MNKVVYFFCMNKEIDPVAWNVFEYIKRNYYLSVTNIIIDGYPVLCYQDNEKNEFNCVQLNNVLSHDYVKYLPIINEYFSEFKFAGVVNWHEGSNAPERILTVHSTGDVPSGVFGKTAPGLMKNLFCALESNRNKKGLENYSTMVEATHWSGIPYKQEPELITGFGTPIYDIEIGSEPISWNNLDAIEVLAKSLLEIFLYNYSTDVIIGVGGKHFEMCFSEFLKNSKLPISIGHILPNQWVSNESYDGELGKDKFRKCISSIDGKVVAIVYHDNLKGNYKQLCRDIAEEYNILAIKHKVLKDPDKLLQNLNL